jgi:hypothetical protein
METEWIVCTMELGTIVYDTSGVMSEESMMQMREMEKNNLAITVINEIMKMLHTR